MSTKTNVFLVSVWFVMIRPVLVAVGDNIKSPFIKVFKAIFRPALEQVELYEREQLINKLESQNRALHNNYVKNQEKAVDNWREKFLPKR